MTNKEAFDILRKVAMKTPVDCTDIKEPKKFYEAIDLAIKALEDVEEWRKLTAVCAFDGYVIYKERTEANDEDSN